MWGLKKANRTEEFVKEDDFLKQQIQKKLENYTNTQGPARFQGSMSIAYGPTVEFELVSTEALKRQKAFQVRQVGYPFAHR